MAFPILGLHHVTATVDGAQEDLDFAKRALGMRLVKKTVNFDNRGVYHFYYGDERGTPGTLWTTFPYRLLRVPPGIKGAGQITVTSLSVPAGSLDAWKKRLRDLGYTVADAPPRFGEESVIVTDPSGLNIELVASKSDARAPWVTNDVGADLAVRGIHSVTLDVANPEPTLAFMREWFGVEVADEMEGRRRVSVGGSGPGKSVDILTSPDGMRAKNGVGTVHHVAFAIADGKQQLEIREALLKRGIQVTPVMDRSYFTSIYFREPGGVLFEVATMGPGFLTDEPAEQLGRGLKLPPWEEVNRADIESALPPIRV